MTQNPYPFFGNKDDVLNGLQEISRQREQDIGDFDNLPQRFVLGRSTDRIPTGSTDVIPTDNVGDVTNDGQKKYELFDIGGNVLEWGATGLGLGFEGITSGAITGMINGAFDVWQRATSFTNPANTDYTVDRWQVLKADGAGTAPSVDVIQNSANAINGSTFSAELDITAVGTADAGRFWRFTHKIEEFDKFADSTITFSLTLSADTTIDLTGGELSIFDGTTTTTTAITQITTTATRIFVSATVGASATELTLQLRLAENNGTISTIGSIFVNQAQLDLGSIPTDFRITNFGFQEWLCRRYFRRISGDSGEVFFDLDVQLNSAGTRTGQGTTSLNPPMRIAPVFSVSAAANFTVTVRNSTAVLSSLTSVAGSINNDIDRCLIEAQWPTVGTPGDGGYITGNTASTFVDLDSEIP